MENTPLRTFPLRQFPRLDNISIIINNPNLIKTPTKTQLKTKTHMIYFLNWILN